jgi:membrane protease YdiL (CAAX protease family)
VWSLFRVRPLKKPVERTEYEPYEVVLPCALAFVATLVLWAADSASVNPFASFPRPSETFMSVAATLLLLAPTVGVVLTTRRSFQSVRLTFAHIRVSLAVGILASLLLLVPTAVLSPLFIVALRNADPIYLFAWAYNSICEELFFRGLIQTRMESLLGSRTGVVVTAMIFNLYHAPAWILGSGLTPTAFIANVILSIPFAVLLGYIAHKSDNIIGSTIFHVAYSLPIIVLA